MNYQKFAINIKDQKGEIQTLFLADAGGSQRGRLGMVSFLPLSPTLGHLQLFSCYDSFAETGKQQVVRSGDVLEHQSEDHVSGLRRAEPCTSA